MKRFLDEKLVFTDLEFNKKEDVLNFLSGELVKSNNVKPEFKQAIIDRENIYPTGLPSAGVNIAIPHADSDLVYNTKIAIGILNSEVLFNSMENINKELKVQIIIMLAIKEPHGQIDMLQKIVGIIQNETLTKKLIKIKDKDEVIEILEPYLN